jgi:uncharacterized protein
MISVAPDNTYYKPKGIPVSELEETVVTLDEFEAIRLADYEQLYQEKAAVGMHISRQTFGRIVESAHYKIASALINGRAIRIAGGDVVLQQNQKYLCPLCKCRLSKSIKGHGQCPHCKQ